MPLKIATASFSLLTFAAAPVLLSQSSPVHHSATHHGATHPTAAGTHRRATADNPPGVPPVHGLPRTLYSLRYVDTLVGTGPLAQPRMYYSVRYTGWLTDGTKFDSSDDHPGKEPITFPYGAHRVIPGWDTGFEGMHVGGKRRLYVPYQLAYGESGRPPVIPPKSDLIFDVELVSMSETPPGALERTPAVQPAAPPPARPAPPPARPAVPPSGSSPGTPEGQPPPTSPPAATKPNPPGR